MVYRSLAPELHLDWINVLLWSLEFVCVAVALVSATRNIFLISDLIEDQVNEWDYCKTFRWWARFEMPACAAAAALFFLHGYWWLFLPHAAYTAYLAYLVYAKKESDVDPTRVHISRDQDAQYWRLMYRSAYYIVALLGTFFGLVYTMSHLYVKNPSNIQAMHRFMGNLLGPVFKHGTQYGGPGRL